MPIFNSLGSNYNFPYLLKSLNGSGADSLKELTQLLEKRYGGETVLFYKGREALSAAIQLLELPEDSRITINGFTCVAVFNAIRKAGFEPLCLDLEETGGLNFLAKTLEKAVSSNKSIKAVVVQNTFGYPSDIEKISAICKEYKLILIEDLAHCVGTKYAGGDEAGTVGDFVILSFSQDKIIDAVSGGALIIRNKNYLHKNKFEFRSPNNQLRDRLYPFFTYKIRTLYNFGLGKPYHFFLKKFNLLSNIMDKSLYDFYSLPTWSARIALMQFENLKKQLEHRKIIAGIYAESLDKSLLLSSIVKTIELSANLRFPVFVEDRTSLIKFLKQHNVYISDIWYTDVAPECPNAVSDSKIIVNLPTHINVSETDARKIANLVNQWTRKS